MGGFWLSSQSVPWMPQVFYTILLNFNWISINKTKIPYISSICMFYLKVYTEDRKKKKKNGRVSWITLRLSLFLLHVLPSLNSFSSTGKGGADKYRTAWPARCWQEKEALRLKGKLWARWSHALCLFRFKSPVLTSFRMYFLNYYPKKWILKFCFTYSHMHLHISIFPHFITNDNSYTITIFLKHPETEMKS